MFVCHRQQIRFVNTRSSIYLPANPLGPCGPGGPAGPGGPGGPDAIVDSLIAVLKADTLWE